MSNFGHSARSFSSTFGGQGFWRGKERDAICHGGRRVIHPDTELRFVSDEIGMGVFASAPIPKGTICIATAWDLEVAGRDIAPGEQLTDDYGVLNLDEPFDCVPEHGTDRTRALPDDLLRHADEWDALALAALADFDNVAQPLAELVAPRFKDRLRFAVETGVLLDSVRETYFDRVTDRV